MKAFLQFLNEKLIVVNNGAAYGNVVFCAGGAGSGKGFAISNFLDSHKFKIRDIDEIKGAFLKLNQMKREIGGDNPYGELHGLDLRNSQDVFKLHSYVNERNIKNRTLNLLLGLDDNGQVINTRDEGKLPNIIIDTTAKEIEDLTNVIPHLLSVGYLPNNIHLMWVLTNFAIAAAANAERSRVVPEDILLKTHVGSAETVWNVLHGEIPHGLNGGIWIILNNRDQTVFAMGNHGLLDGSNLYFNSKGELIRPEDVEKIGKSVYIDKISDETLIVKQRPVVVSDFSYLQFKVPGHPLEPTEKMKLDVYKWAVNNVPSPEDIASIPKAKIAPDHLLKAINARPLSDNVFGDVDK